MAENRQRDRVVLVVSRLGRYTAVGIQSVFPVNPEALCNSGSYRSGALLQYCIWGKSMLLSLFSPFLQTNRDFSMTIQEHPKRDNSLKRRVQYGG